MTPFALIAPLQWLVDASGAILTFFHDSVGFGWGASIIAMTVVIRLAILPLTFKGVKGMQEMQRLQPEIKRIQERYKEDRQRLQQETMKLYREHEINPLASCLPLLLQIPFFIALFYLLQDDPDLKGEPFLFIPDLGAQATGAVLVTLIVVYVATQLGASLVTLVSADKTQRRIFLALPFVFVFIIVNFPAGLIVYWITTNVWTVGQQLLVRKLYPKPEPIQASDEDASKPARGKPATATAVSGGASGQTGRKARGAEGDGAKAGSGSKATAEKGGDAGNGRPRKAPPPSPRKKKKRSGRRR
jgi:YidC/Oxa1 family membrane protein insertase